MQTLKKNSPTLCLRCGLVLDFSLDGLGACANALLLSKAVCSFRQIILRMLSLCDLRHPHTIISCSKTWIERHSHLPPGSAQSNYFLLRFVWHTNSLLVIIHAYNASLHLSIYKSASERLIARHQHVKLAFSCDHSRADVSDRRCSQHSI